MAIFEKTYQSKIILDDTERLTCILENSQNIDKHTEYILRVQRGPSKVNKWDVSRRYRDFSALHQSLQLSNIDLPLPPKKLLGNMQPSFIAERQVALQNYIKEVLKHQVLALSLSVRSFLDPKSYSVTIAEQALQTISIALRGDGRYELKGPLSDIGWRIRKHFFMVTDTVNRTNYMLTWVNYGPDKSLNSKDLQTAFKCLQSMSHPFMDEVLGYQILETGAYIIRKVHDNGSVRDILYGTEYARNYLAKYGNPKIKKPFTTGQISHYGYQILQALKFMHDKGLPHGHIHPGNMTIENQKVIIMDTENMLLGIPCLYRPHLVELRHAATSESIDVYCFGRTLYEMALATTLEKHYCDIYPDDVPKDLEAVLWMCLSSTSGKHGGTTLDELLHHPFFTRAALNGLAPRIDGRTHLKFPLPLKEELKKAADCVLLRLKADQKMLRTAKREVRIQEILNSEEELKKQKRRAKKRDSMWKSTSSLAETVRSHSVSTASSPTPPAISSETSGNGSVIATSPSEGRGALLQAICSFDKTRLARVNSG